MTECEKLIWKQIRLRKLGVQFFRQFPILDYVVDFYSKEIGLVVEIDGSSHNNNILEDGKRQGRIEELGVRFIRFSNSRVLNELDLVIDELQTIVNESIKH